MDLTPREREVTRLIALGRSSKQVAADLGISFRTVVCHRFHIFRKLSVTNTAELVGQAVRMGLVDFPSSVSNAAQDGGAHRPSDVSAGGRCLTCGSQRIRATTPIRGMSPEDCEKTDRLRFEFLSKEFDLCFTLLEFAWMNDWGQLQRTRQMAERGYSTISRFLDDPKHVRCLTAEQLTTLRGRMHLLRGALDGSPPPGSARTLSP